MLPKGLLKEYSKALALVFRLFDAFLIFIAAIVSYYLKFKDFFIPPAYLIAIVVGTISGTGLFTLLQIYTSTRAKGLMKHFLHLVQAVAILSVLLAGLAFFTKVGEHYSRQWFVTWMFLSLCLLIAYRNLLFFLLRFMRSRGLNERRVVIMGAGDLGIKFAQSIQQALWTGFRIKVFMDDNAALKPTSILDIPVIQTPVPLGDYLSENQIDEIWLALPLRAEGRMKSILHELRHQTITTRYVLDIFSLDLLNHSISEVAGFPVINIRSTPMMGLNRLTKAIEDRILAFIILLLISPLMLLIAIIVKMSSPGPIFYRQKRVGWNGKEFEMLKFRTMPTNAESQTGPIWATKEDERATFIGKCLRRTSLDELPQFINVLLGQMSIVGPRPERKIFVEEFKDQVPGYMQKHQVKAGITGWAQINGWRGNTSLEKRIEYDLYYINHWSLFFDLKIILLTVLRGFVNRNAY